MSTDAGLRREYRVGISALEVSVMRSVLMTLVVAVKMPATLLSRAVSPNSKRDGTNTRERGRERESEKEHDRVLFL